MAKTGAAGRHVPPWSSLDALVAFLLDRIGDLWRWRDVVVPIGVLYLAAMVGGGRGLVVAIASLVASTTVLALVRPSAVRGVVGRCVERSAARRWQRRWPGICRGLHWYRQLGEGDGLLVPQLLSWWRDDHTVDVALRPLPEQTADSWDKMADALRRFLGGASVEWRESRGTLRIVIGRHALPAVLPWRSEGGLDGRLVLGRRHGGAQLAIDLGSTAHVLLAGATGSGKGGTIRAATAAALEAGWSVVVLDPKEAGEYAWLEMLGVPVATDLPNQVAALGHLDQVRRTRQAAIKSRGADGLLDMPVETRELWRPVLLVVDEAADLLTVTKGKTNLERNRAALQQRAGELIAELARKGRSAGIHLLVAVQRPDLTQLGEQGGALRNNLTARLALGNLDADGLRMLGVSSTDPVALALDGTRGGESASGSLTTLDQASVRSPGSTRNEPAARSSLLGIKGSTTSRPSDRRSKARKSRRRRSSMSRPERSDAGRVAGAVHQLRQTSGCANPIRLRGRRHRVDKTTGEVVSTLDTSRELGGALVVACGDRREAKCPSCSRTYQGDAFQLVAAGLRGGKGISEAVAGHPRCWRP